MYSAGHLRCYGISDLLSKIAFFKRAWQTLKVLPPPWASNLKFLRGRGFQKGAIRLCSSRGRKAAAPQMSAPADAAFGFYGNGAWLVSAFFPVQDFHVVEVGLEHAGVAHNAHLKRFLGRLVREEAEGQRAFRAVVVFPTDSRVVVRLIGSSNDSVDGVTTKGADEFGSCAEPPIHQIKMMAIFVY